MPFSIRPCRCLTVQCAVTHNAGLFHSQGTLLNISCTEWATDRSAGSLGAVVERAGDSCPPDDHIIPGAQASILMCVRGATDTHDKVAVDY